MDLKVSSSRGDLSVCPEIAWGPRMGEARPEAVRERGRGCAPGFEVSPTCAHTTQQLGPWLGWPSLGWAIVSI